MIALVSTKLSRGRVSLHLKMFNLTKCNTVSNHVKRDDFYKRFHNLTCLFVNVNSP